MNLTRKDVVVMLLHRLTELTNLNNREFAEHVKAYQETEQGVVETELFIEKLNQWLHLYAKKLEAQARFMGEGLDQIRSREISTVAQQEAIEHNNEIDMIMNQPPSKQEIEGFYNPSGLITDDGRPFPYDDRRVRVG